MKQILRKIQEWLGDAFAPRIYYQGTMDEKTHRHMERISEEMDKLFDELKFRKYPPIKESK